MEEEEEENYNKRQKCVGFWRFYMWDSCERRGGGTSRCACGNLEVIDCVRSQRGYASREKKLKKES